MHALLIILAALGAAAGKPSCPSPPGSVPLLNSTESGFLEIDSKGSKLFYLFYESPALKEQGGREWDVPVTLWLQGGPGCSSLFGALYELGPEVVDERLGLQLNPGTWNRKSALLFIDQPVGSGFSVPGSGRGIPTDEMTLAADLYAGLQAFFHSHPHLQRRPLVIAGESYAGKYVPSVAHYILSQAVSLTATRSLGRLAPTAANGAPRRPLQHRPMPAQLAATRPLLAQPPLFDLRGLAIGNGLTDPAAQVMTHADTAFYMGYIDLRQRLHATTMQLQTLQLISEGEWEEAHSLRNHVLDYIRRSAGVATMLDMRRLEDYDAAKLTDCYLNLPEVKEALGVNPAVHYVACSEAVADALGPDVMRSVRHLVPDLLAAYPLLLYQGMHDAQDGAASSEAWMSQLDWEGGQAFVLAQRSVIRAKDVEAGGGGGSGANSSSGERSSSSGAGMSNAAGLHPPGGSGGSVVGWRQLQAEPRSGGAQLHPRQQPQPSQQQEGQGQHADQGGGAGNRVVAYWKSGGGLTHVVLTDAGHMTPRDAPQATQWMLESWLAAELGRG